MFDAAVEEFGGVDVAVNTSGMVLRKPIVEFTEEEYDRMFAINAKAAFFFIQEADRRLNDNGKIVSLGTSLLRAITDGYSTYAGAKAPIEHFTRAAAKEFADRGISVNTVAPGPMDTSFSLWSGRRPANRVLQGTHRVVDRRCRLGWLQPEDLNIDLGPLGPLLPTVR